MPKDAQTLPPSHPLPNPKHEAFCLSIADGLSIVDAYCASYPKAERRGARISGSQLAKTEAVKNRIAWLNVRNQSQSEKTPEKKRDFVRPDRKEAPEPPPKPNKKTAFSSQISREEVIDQLSVAIRHGSTSEITQATQALLKIMPEIGAGTDDDKPDPLQVAHYLASWAGYPGHDLVKELGGLELLTRKWIHVLQVDVKELLAVVRKIARVSTDSDTTSSDSVLDSP